MKTNVSYECEFCGFTSTDQEKVRACEAQGSKAKFKVGDPVTVNNATLPNGKCISYAGVIADVSVERHTHKVLSYGVHNNLGGSPGIAILVPERDIEKREGASQSTT